MSDIEPMTPAQICDTKYGVAGFVNEYTIRQLLATIDQLHAQLAALKRQEKNWGDDRDYWFQRTKELKAQLDTVTAKARTEGRKEGLEEAAKLQCPLCVESEPFEFKHESGTVFYGHIQGGPCSAQAIRCALSSPALAEQK